VSDLCRAEELCGLNIMARALRPRQANRKPASMITRRGMLTGSGSVVAGMAAGARAGHTRAPTKEERSETMQITRAGSQPSNKGSPGIFHRDGAHRSAFPSARPKPRLGRQRHIRARRSHSLAYPSTRPDFDHHRRCRMGSARRRSDRRGPARRRGLVSTGPQALARSNAKHRDDSYGYPGNPERKERRLDGEGQR
jgi:hypothetical protein